MKKTHRLQSGFTLIELIIVVIIVALLATIIGAILSDARAKGRDAERLSAMRQIQNALQLHFSTLGGYPADLSVIADTEFISEIPVDPLGGSYAYIGIGCAGGICKNYHMGASLQKTNIVLDADSDFDSTLAGGFSGSDDSPCQGTDAGLFCYDTLR